MEPKRCGNCRYYEPTPARHFGHCYGNPPVITNDGNSERPTVSDTDRACRLFVQSSEPDHTDEGAGE